MGVLDRVKNLCTDKGISVGDLEKELELSNGSIYKWSKTTPGADKVEKVADYFGVTTDYLLGRTAFKNSFELLEHWGYSSNGFESAFDFGELLKKEREAQGISQEEVSEALNITFADIENIEEGLLPLNYKWAEKYAKFLGTSVSQIFFDNDMYDEQIPSQFNGDVKAYENFKKAEKEDVLKESFDSEIHTIAAHKDGQEWTEEELQAIEDFKQYVLSKRDKK